MSTAPRSTPTRSPRGRSSTCPTRTASCARAGLRRRRDLGGAGAAGRRADRHGRRSTGSVGPVRASPTRRAPATCRRRSASSRTRSRAGVRFGRRGDARSAPRHPSTDRSSRCARSDRRRSYRGGAVTEPSRARPGTRCCAATRASSPASRAIPVRTWSTATRWRTAQTPARGAVRLLRLAPLRRDHLRQGARRPVRRPQRGPGDLRFGRRQPGVRRRRAEGLADRGARPRRVRCGRGRDRHRGRRRRRSASAHLRV